MGGGVDRRRRRFVALLGVLGFGSLAGCTGGTDGTSGVGDTPAPTPTPGGPADIEAGGGAKGDEHEDELPLGISMEAFVSGPVPDAYRTALSCTGERRDLADLRTKESVRLAEAHESEFVTPGQNGGNCAEYIADKNGNGFGACAKVEGYVGAEDWCVIWESIEDHETEAEAEE